MMIDLKSRRIQLGLTMLEVAKAVGVSEATISRYESGNIKNMRRDRIENYAKILQVNPAVLLGVEVVKEDTSSIEILPKSEIRMIPVFESVSAGFGAYASNDIIDYIPIYIESDFEAEETLCITVSGDSMYPKIEDGDIVQVRKQSMVDSGQIAVVLLDDEEGLVKKIKFGDDYIELISINPEYPPKKFVKEEMNRISIVGLVRKIIKEC